jgi:hypothetical protein
MWIAAEDFGNSLQSTLKNDTGAIFSET